MFIQKITFTALLLGSSIVCMQQNSRPASLILDHRKRKPDELHRQLPSSLSAKPLVQLTALAEQADHFSCGYRTLFHACCIDIALAKAEQGKSISESLKELLPNTGMLFDIYTKVQSYLDDHDRTHDRTRGLHDHHILGICREKVTSLQGNIALALLDADDKFYTLRDPGAPANNPLYYSFDFVTKYNTAQYPEAQCRITIDNSDVLKYQLKKLESPLQVAHFICRYPNHFFLASMVTDREKTATLYVIDSNNNNVTNIPKIYALVTKLLSYVETHNSKKPTGKKQKALDPDHKYR